MTTIKPIETRYAGCRFRSRLEARWAVFFDTLDLPWEYEPEGLEVTWRLSLRDDIIRYLPDFWLPSLGVYAEVKGALTPDEHIRLLNIAASLSSNDGGGCHDRGGHDLVVLGAVPRPGPVASRQVLYPRLHLHKGDLIASAFLGLNAYPCMGTPVARDVGGDNIFDCGHSELAVRRLLLEGVIDKPLHPHAYLDAVTAARSARFEHGEQG